MLLYLYVLCKGHDRLLWGNQMRSRGSELMEAVGESAALAR